VLTLYFAPNSCALASHIALEQAGAPYQTVRVDFSKTEQRSAEYLGVNPKGRVPSLLTERGILTETPAILMYVCQAFPQANLRRGHRWADDPAAIEAMRKKVPQTVGECFELIERHLFKGPWVMGEHYTVSDMYLFTLAQWLERDEVDPARFPKVAEHRQRMLRDPVVSKVIAAELAGS
jgi:glutathione S-transferase